MSTSRRLARPLLASMFISGGLDALRHPETKVKAAEHVTRPLSETIGAIPDDTALLVRLNGGVQVAGAVLLSLGKFRRLAALALIGSIIPTTYAGHRFWEELDEEDRAQQRVHFLKNLGLLGGLILAAVDTEGAPSIGWRLRQHGRRGSRASKRNSQCSGPARQALTEMTRAGAQALNVAEDFAVDEVAKGVKLAGPYLHAGAERAGALLTQAQDHLAAR
ncbi:MAG TPA: DoxX family protein [Acidimicrobiales bacterium]